MNGALNALGVLSAFLRSALLGVGIGFAIVAVADWAARTRRINPFGGIARFTRTRVDPHLAGIERQVVRVGGHQSATPWWALVAYVLVAALLLAAIDLLIGLLSEALRASALGGAGVFALLLHWVFRFLSFALLVRVLSSWFPRAAQSPWLRWSFGATEWMLRPLRGLLPTIGVIDITPIVAYFGLQLVEWLLMRVLFPGFG